MEAVLVSMSCFELLCEEAEILCGSDEVAVTSLLPNYQLYMELAQASNVVISGEFHFIFRPVVLLYNLIGTIAAIVFYGNSFRDIENVSVPLCLISSFFIF